MERHISTHIGLQDNKYQDQWKNMGWFQKGKMFEIFLEWCSLQFVIAEGLNLTSQLWLNTLFFLSRFPEELIRLIYCQVGVIVSTGPFMCAQCFYQHKPLEGNFSLLWQAKPEKKNILEFFWYLKFLGLGTGLLRGRLKGLARRDALSCSFIKRREKTSVN